MAHATPSKDCLIHCTDDITTVNTLRDIDSWKSLLVAAETREYLPVLEYRNVDGIPAITYHPKCRKIFTMKRDLEKIKSSNETNMDTSLTKIPESRSSMRLSSPGPSPCTSILHPACIFCEKKEKYKKRKRETLLNCSMFSADNTLRETAKLKNDSRMMSINSHCE